MKLSWLYFSRCLLIVAINAFIRIETLDSARVKKRNQHAIRQSPKVEEIFSFNQTSGAERQHRDFAVIDLNEFVARVKGGIQEAERVAQKFNLKLIRQVTWLFFQLKKYMFKNNFILIWLKVFDDSNYFLFEKETVDSPKSLGKSTQKQYRIRRSLEIDEINLLENEPSVSEFWAAFLIRDFIWNFLKQDWMVSRTIAQIAQKARFR